MIRRLLVVFAVLAATAIGAVPASADGGTVTQTTHFTSVPSFAAPIPCSSLAGWNQIDEDGGNGVIHSAVNSNGFWLTGTYEGHVTVQPANPIFDANGHLVGWTLDKSGARPSAQGHVTDWFGVSFNNTIVVDHDALNVQLTTSTGEAISFHAIGHIQATVPLTNPPTITHEFMTFSCS